MQRASDARPGARGARGARAGHRRRLRWARAPAARDRAGDLRDPAAEATPEPEPALPEQLRGLPPDAARTVVEVREAAEAGDLAALRRHMADHFSWSFGGNVSADEAIAHWRERPTVVAELVEMIDRGCRQDPGTGYVVCPPAYGGDPEYLGFRAGFDRQDGEWKMIFFVAGD